MKSPFKFLDSFTKEDKEIFFGRDKETEELYHKIFESKILLVYGVSGTGKSSLINCGLVSKFSESDWLPVNVRRGGNIIESMARSLSSAALTPLTLDTEKSSWLKKGIRSLYLDHFKPIFIVFDQFEELFIFGSKSEKEEFIKVLNSVIESDLQCRFLFVIREEYLASITEFEKHIPSFLANRVRIEKMTRLNAQQAIEGPCKYAGIDVEEGFSNQLLDRLSPEGAEIELTYLQVYLDKIFRTVIASEERAKQSYIGMTFTNDILEKLGDVKDLLGSFLEEQIAELSDPDTALVVLKAFVSTKGTKRQVTLEEVLDYSRTLGKDVNKEILQELIHRFVSLRILRDKDESGRYELRHDALAAKIFEKITVFEKDLLEIRQFIENAHANYEKRALLLSVADLKYISQYEDKIFLSGDLFDFVNKSKEDIHIKQRVLNRITALSVVILLMVFSLFIVKFIKTQNNDNSRDNALSALYEIEDPISGLFLAIESYNTQPRSLSQKAIFLCFNKIAENFRRSKKVDPFKQIFDFKPCNKKILFADFSNEGNVIYGYSADSIIYIWERSGEVRLKLIASEVPINLKLSNDSRFISAVFPSRKTEVWKINGDSITSFKVYFDEHNTNDIISFAYNKNLVAALSEKNMVILYNLQSGKIFQELFGHKADVTSVCFSPDERFLATTSKDSSTIIWYFNRNKNKFEIYSTIHDNNGIVWSVQFNNSSNYILTASEDSSAKMYRLTGEPHDFLASYGGYLYSLSNMTPICRAEFTKSPVNIVLTRSLSKSIIERQADNFRKTSTSTNGYTNFYDEDTTITEIDISPVKHNSFQALTKICDSTTSVISTFSRNYFHIIDFPGIHPRFSPDGNYLLTIGDKHLNLFPVSIEEMERLLFDKKIFGEIKKSDDKNFED